MARTPILTHVESVERVTPHLFRVVLGGDDLRAFGAGTYTDHYVKLQLPPSGAEYSAPFDIEDVKARFPREQWPRTRTYTVREYDGARLTLDFVYHGDHGLAGPWAANAQPGDALQLMGPGGAYAPDPDADWHLMVGDESVLPAIAASLPRVPAGVPVVAILEVADAQEELELETPGDLQATWLHRNGNPDALVDAVRALDFPAGALQGFVHGEAAAVRDIRQHLLTERGVPREALSISGYWKQTWDEDTWQARKREFA